MTEEEEVTMLEAAEQLSPTNSIHSTEEGGDISFNEEVDADAEIDAGTHEEEIEEGEPSQDIPEAQKPEEILDYITANLIPQILEMKEEDDTGKRVGKTIPSSFKKEFLQNLYKSMSNLTEIAYRIEGKTLLFIPPEKITLAVRKKKKKEENAEVEGEGEGEEEEESGEAKESESQPSSSLDEASKVVKKEEEEEVEKEKEEQERMLEQVQYELDMREQDLEGEIVQRLEGCLIHWTRQIKEVLSETRAISDSMVFFLFFYFFLFLAYFHQYIINNKLLKFKLRFLLFLFLYPLLYYYIYKY
jgi:hypothetical protein